LPCEDLLLSATCTDGGGKALEIYLNGVNLATSGIEAVSLQGNEIEYYDLTPFIDLLRPGTNTIAVALNNVWQPSWDDVAFDLNLKAASYAPVAARINSVNREAPPLQGIPATELSLSIPPNTVWRVECADVLPTDTWQLVDVITNSSATGLLLRDAGQNGRLPPGETPARFYRLIPN
jgi:hypothetical protein